MEHSARLIANFTTEFGEALRMQNLQSATKYLTTREKFVQTITSAMLSVVQNQSQYLEPKHLVRAFTLLTRKDAGKALAKALLIPQLVIS